MSVWSTPDGKILCRIGKANAFALIDTDELRVRTTYEDGTAVSEDERYTWSYWIEDGALRKRFETTEYGEAPVVKTSTTVAGLTVLRGDEADRWLRASTKLLAQNVAPPPPRSTDHVDQFLRDVPPWATDLVFRLTPDGWGVAVKGADASFWIAHDWHGRGKDLHYELERALKLRDTAVDSFAMEVEGNAALLAYYGE